MINRCLLYALPLIALLFSCGPTDKNEAESKNNEDLNKVEVKGKNTVFYTDDVTEKQAKKLSKLLQELGWFDDESKTAVRAEKAEDGYNVAFSVSEETDKNQKGMIMLWLLQLDISDEVFDGETTHIIPSDTKLKKFKHIHIDPAAVYKPQDDCSIVYNNKIYQKKDAKAIANVLDEDGYLKFKGDKRILISKENDENIVRFLVSKEKVEDHPGDFKNQFLSLLAAIKKDVFNGEATALYLSADNNYEDFIRVQDEGRKNNADGAASLMGIDSLFSVNQSSSRSELKSVRASTDQ